MVNQETLYYSTGNRVVFNGNVGKVTSTQRSEDDSTWLICITFDNGNTDCINQAVVQSVTVAGACSPIINNNS
jgi:hypothetical protein